MLCVLALARALSLPPRPPTPLPSGAIVQAGVGAQLDDYLTRCSAFGFAGTALVEKDGVVVLAKGYGLAEREPARANDVDTIFDIGSLTKQFTAAAILHLEQERKLAVTDPITKFFSGVPSDKSKITLHQLLNHTSGMPRALRNIGSELHERAQLVRFLLAAPLESKPGARHTYSNVGYDLLAAVVEVASERSFEDYLRDSLFAPAKMESTGFRRDGLVPPARAARGYQASAQPDLTGSAMKGEHEKPTDPTLATHGWYSWGLRGAGGVLTTVGDLARWQAALDGTSILNDASKQKLFEPGLGDYAYGWHVHRTERGSPWIEHGGSTDNGFACKFTRFPKERLLSIVLGNVGDGSVPWVSLNLGKLARGEEIAWPPAVTSFDAERSSALVGVHEASGARFALSDAADRLIMEAENAPAMTFLHPAPSSAGILRRTEAIASALAQNNFGPLHAAEAKSKPLWFFDDWFLTLTGTRGKLERVSTIGVIDEPGQGAVGLIKLQFVSGAELLKLGWHGEALQSTKIGAPYPSRITLRPTVDGAWVAYDLLRSKPLVTVQLAQRSGAVSEGLDLVAGTRKLQLVRAKD
jgi:CubicO group peptidase (beta-lactamase class C family)